jgi:hypothetical protein
MSEEAKHCKSVEAFSPYLIFYSTLTIYSLFVQSFALYSMGKTVNVEEIVFKMM